MISEKRAVLRIAGSVAPVVVADESDRLVRVWGDGRQEYVVCRAGGFVPAVGEGEGCDGAATVDAVAGGGRRPVR